MDGRKKNGGARPGAGRKPKATEIKLAECLDLAWPEEERVAALKKVADMASAGDLAALKLLLAYAYGRPTERVEHSGPAGEPIKYLIGVDESDL